MNETSPIARSNVSPSPGLAVVVLLCVTMFAACLAYGGVDTGMLAALSTLSAVTVLVWAWTAVRAGTLDLKTSPLQLPLVALAAIGIVQLLPLGDAGIAAGTIAVEPAAALSFEPYATRLFLARLVLYIIFFAAALTWVNSERRLKAVAAAIVAFGAAIAFFGILQWLAKPAAIYGLRASPQAIPFGPYVNQHHFAALMEMTSGVALGLLFGGALHRSRVPLLVAAVIVMGTAIVMTGSRGGMISFIGVAAFGIAGGLMTRRRHGRAEASRTSSGRLLAVAGGIALVLLIAGLAVFLGGAESLLRGTGLTGGTGDVTSGRGHFWRTGLKIFLDHPLLGTGLDAFGTAFTRYDTTSGAFRVEQAHNDYLQILCDAGVAGFVCVAAFIYLLFSAGFRTIVNAGSKLRASVAVGALAGCLGIAIHSFFDFPLRTPANAYFFLMLATLAVARVATPDKDGRHRRGHSTGAAAY
ncbi:MAG: O-antigen ligase family protein [Pyrinomonadaceae bacterium]